MTLADLIAQTVVFLGLLTLIANRNLIEDMADGNVERLERMENKP